MSNIHKPQQISNVLPKPAQKTTSRKTLIIGAFIANLVYGQLESPAVEELSSDIINTDGLNPDEQILGKFKFDQIDKITKNDILEAYKAATEVVGEIRWTPSRKVEIKEVDETTNCLTDLEKNTLTINKACLQHEMVHYLLGPEFFANVPLTIQEIIASTLSPEPTVYTGVYSKSIATNPILRTTGRFIESEMIDLYYQVAQEVGLKHKSKWPEVITALISAYTTKGSSLTIIETENILKSLGITDEITKAARNGSSYGGIALQRKNGRVLLPMYCLITEGEDQFSPRNVELTVTVTFKDGTSNFNTNIYGLFDPANPESLDVQEIPEFPLALFLRTNNRDIQDVTSIELEFNGEYSRCNTSLNEQDLIVLKEIIE